MSIIELTIDVENAAQIANLYDRLQIFRSPDKSGSPTPFVSITETVPEAAIINGTVSGPWNLNGQILNISLDAADPVVVSFSGTNPFGLQVVLDILNSSTQFAPEIASELPTDTNKIRLTSPVFGTQSIIQLSGAAATTLGLSTEKVNGKGASPLLSPNTEKYIIIDFDGLSALWYKARYVNTLTGAVSSFSDPFLGGPGTGLPGSTLVTGRIALADLSGHPLANRRVIFVATSPQIVSDGSGNNYGVLPSVDRITVVTDANGRALVSLVKGQRLKVFLEGTTFQREFVVPTTDFDILTVSSFQPDPLSVVVAPPFPIRVS